MESITNALVLFVPKNIGQVKIRYKNLELIKPHFRKRMCTYIT